MSGFKIAATAAVLTFAFISQPAWSGANLGQPASEKEVQAWDISIGPDGAGLPAGKGTAKDGATIYEAKCLSCHGKAGAGGKKLADRMVGGIGTRASAKPMKTVGSFWPYATTLFDYIRRAMPFDVPLSLTDDEVYALTAYILWLNDGIVAEEQVVNSKTLPKIKMPNRDGFVSHWPPK